MSENWKQWQGQTVGDDFQLVEYLGGSANSAAYLAAAPDDAKAAIKLIVDDPATAEAHLARWRIAESLSHPHLLKVFRSGRCELGGTSLLYVVMEFAEENLSQILPHRPLTTDEASQMLPPVLDALDYLHGNGLIHGNLKPGNIMAGGDQLKLSPDGILKAGQPGKSSGAYCPPEAAQGVLPASDIWSLGVTLVEVLTQRLPVWEEGAALPQLPDNLPEQFRVIVQHCLLQDVNLRAKTADIRERLKPIVVPTVQAPVTTQKQPTPVATSNPRSAKRFVIPAAIAVVGIGAVIAIPKLSEQTPEAAKPAAVESQAASAPSQPAPTTAAPPVMSEATEPPPDVRESKVTRSEQIEVLVGERPSPKPSAASPKPVVVAPKSTVVAEANLERPLAKATVKQDGVVNQVLPDVPQRAMNTISGKVRVRVKVQVNSQGNVVNSEFTSAGPSKYFANMAMEAARQWKFAPSEAANRAWDLQFEFRRSGITSVPMQIDR